MLLSFVLILGLAVLFYLAIPGVGAILVRNQWRGFRQTIIAVSRYPAVNPLQLAREQWGYAGLYRFFGSLEAIQGEDRIWITNGRHSVEADLRNVRIYMLPEAEISLDEALQQSRLGSLLAGASDDVEPKIVSWDRVFSLPEGTPMLVGGALFAEDGRGVFRSRGKDKLLVVIHDCPRQSIIPRAIWSGRHRNEFMNAFTLPAVVTGALSLAFLAYSLLSNPGQRLAAIAALTLGLAPMTPFLPPGFLFYFAYRAYWKKARLMRAQRDVTLMPLRYFSQDLDRSADRWDTRLPDGEPYMMIKGRLQGPEMRVLATDGGEFELPDGTQRIEVNLPRIIGDPSRRRGALTEDPTEYAAFGACVRVGDREVLAKPEDPMAQFILVRGDPEEISRQCNHAARLYEIVSAFFIGLNLAVNIPLVFLALAALIG